MHNVRAVLREPHFRQLFAARLAAQAADGCFQAALAGYVIFSPERHTTAAQIAGAFAVLLLPFSVVGPFAGVFLDRWRRQRILVVANLLRAALVCGVAGLAAGGVDDWRLLAAALCVLSVNRFFLAALSAALPHVVDARRLVTANSLTTTSGTLVAITGGGIGVGIREVLGEDGTATALTMLVAAVVYLCSALVASTMAADLLGPDLDTERPETLAALRHVLTGVVAGARHVWQHRRAGHALLAIAAHRFCYGLSTVSSLLLYRNYFADDGFFRAGLDGLAQLFVASGIGFLVAALVTPAAARRLGTETWVVLCYAGAAVVEATLLLSYTKQAFLPAAFMLGLAAQSSKICVDTIVQESVDDAYRGRVFSFYDIVFNVAFVAAATAGALVVPDSGRSYAVLVVIALGYAATAAVYRVVSAAGRR